MTHLAARGDMLYLTVHLYGRKGIRGEFREYERKALAIFQRHGGEVVAAYVPIAVPGSSLTALPDEVQVLRIGDRQDLDRFMSDPERAAMAKERESVLERTEVFLSGEPVDYSL